MPLNKKTSVTEYYEEYKRMTAKHAEYIANLKEEVMKIVNQKQLVACMSDTKWLKLQCAVEELPFPPPFVERCVTDTEPLKEQYLTAPPRFYGNWSNYYNEGMPALFNIEWIKVRPQVALHRGRLVADEVIDETAEFRAMLERLNIPYEEQENVFTIYGYKKLG